MLCYWQNTGTLNPRSGRHAIKKNYNFSNVRLSEPSPPLTVRVNSIFVADWEIKYQLPLMASNFLFNPKEIPKHIVDLLSSLF